MQVWAELANANAMPYSQRRVLDAAWYRALRLYDHTVTPRRLVCAADACYGNTPASRAFQLPCTSCVPES